MSECESYGSSEGLSSHQGNNKLPVAPTQTSLGTSDIRPHLPVTRSSSGPHDHRGQAQLRSPLHQQLCDQSGALSSDNLAGMTGRPACPSLKVGTHTLSPLNYTGQLRDTHISRSTPSLLMYQSDLQSPQYSPQSPASQPVDAASGTGHIKGPAAPGWHAERWHIWHILSKENVEALPETLVWCPHWQWSTVLILWSYGAHSAVTLLVAETLQSVSICSTSWAFSLWARSCFFNVLFCDPWTVDISMLLHM